MLTHTRTATLLALAALAPVLADARSATIFALASLVPVLANAPSATRMACVALPPVFANALSATLLALAFDPVVRFAPRWTLADSFSLCSTVGLCLSHAALGLDTANLKYSGLGTANLHYFKCCLVQVWTRNAYSVRSCILPE